MTSLTSRGQLLLMVGAAFCTAGALGGIPALVLTGLPLLVLLVHAWMVSSRRGRLVENGALGGDTAETSLSCVRGRSASLRLTVFNRGTFDAGALQLDVVLPDGLTLGGGPLRFAELPSGSEFDVDVELRGDRTGVHALSSIRIGLGDALALARTHVHQAIDVALTVLPDAVDRVPSRRRVTDAGDFVPGRHRRDRPGSGLDLRELREYRSGDLVRHIAWKPSLRSRELLVRQHEDESSTQAMILLDVGSGMRGAEGRVLERAMDVALSMAMQLQSDQDAVGIYAFDDAVVGGLAPARSPVQAEAIARHLAVLPRVVPEESSEAGDDGLLEPIVRWIALVDRVDLAPALRRAGPDDGRALIERYLLGRHGQRIARWERLAASAGFDVSAHGVLRRAAAAAGLPLGWRAEVRYGSREQALANVFRRVVAEHPRVRKCFVLTDLGGMIGNAGLRGALAPAIGSGIEVTFAVGWTPELLANAEGENDALREAMMIAERRQKQRRVDELRSAGAGVVLWGDDAAETIAARVLEGAPA